MAGNRPKQVGERIREELMDLLIRGAVKDPAVRDVTICSVDVSGDLRHARIYVRTMEESEPERQQILLRGLGRAQGFFRRELAGRLGLRHMPELRFSWDDTADRAARVESLLDQIKREDDQ